MTTSPPPCFCSQNKLLVSHCKLKVRKKCPPVRSQSFHNQGNSPANMVDSNMSVLRERIREVIRKREWLENENGWNYKSVGYDYNNKHKRHAMVFESLELFGLVTGAFGLVFLSGSLCIFLVSFVVHLQN
ncbi:uncharacterized protein LOC131300561 [Rhododendron vialii]|uniref:uncharacterized protein LOC131300561 n=1 Tax=Rhododendron vialii TaxID=182163 RepID=UPI00265F053A|nr:uncharacterized protein LOC131300561 [Rhododendron vialii]